MTQFLDKFRGRASRVGKEGILELLNEDFKPISHTEERKTPYRNNILTDRTKSIELNRAESRIESVVLPPIKLDLK
jgi:hypothetical protein